MANTEEIDSCTMRSNARSSRFCSSITICYRELDQETAVP